MEPDGQFIVALDLGTTSARAIVFDRKASPVSIAQREIAQIHPQPGWVEQDPMEIWAAQSAVLVEALAKVGLQFEQVAGIGITNQRETCILWERTSGRPVYNAIVWQSRQTAPICDQLKSQGMQEHVGKTTGLVIDPYFSATKIQWIFERVEGARERARQGKLLFGTVDSWLIWKLTRGKVHVTDYTNAARTMLFDIHKLDWDPVLLEVLDIPRQMLPRVVGSSGIVGHAYPGPAQRAGIPIAGIAGDQQAALFGQMCVAPGQVKNTYGTGCFVLMNTGSQAIASRHGLLTTLACGPGGKLGYALEGGIFSAGSTVRWLRDKLKVINDSYDSEYFATKAGDNHGVYLVPAFSGLGAPYWDPYARGALFGLTQDTTVDHIIRAALESIAYQTRDVLDAMVRDAGDSIRSLRVDGGVVSNNFLMQFQADLLGLPVERPEMMESTALGAAYLAGLATGYWSGDEALVGTSVTERIFQPQLEPAEREHLYRNWLKAVARARGWARDE